MENTYIYLTKTLKYPPEKCQTLKNLNNACRIHDVRQACNEFLESKDYAKDKSVWFLHWCELERRYKQTGWYGEKMPVGIQRADEPLLYYWTKDESYMCYIPPGLFFMGANENDTDVYNNECKPCIQKNISHGYYIDIAPVTIGQYKKFLSVPDYRAFIVEALERGNAHNSLEIWKTNRENYTYVDYEEKFFSSISELQKVFLAGSQFTIQNNYVPIPWKCNDNYPMIGVSWFEAMAYSLWVRKALPTEWEWEKAGRGGGQVPLWQDNSWKFVANLMPQRKYTWGDSWNDKQVNSASYWMAGISTYNEWQKRFIPENLWKKQTMTTFVRDPRFLDSVSPYGVYDMLGNVWEWCRNWYSTESNKSVIERRYKACRGGSWRDARRNMRLHCRGKDAPARRGDILGFRCVCVPGVFSTLESET